MQFFSDFDDFAKVVNSWLADPDAYPHGKPWRLQELPKSELLALGYFGPNRRLREPFRAPKKIHRQIRQPVRQGNTLLVRQFAATAALHLLQERPLDRIGGGLVCGFAFVAVAPLTRNWYGRRHSEPLASFLTKGRCCNARLPKSLFAMDQRGTVRRTICVGS